MFVEIANLTYDSNHNSAVSLTFDWLALGRILGFRVAEYSQTTQSQVDEYEYASGNKVIKLRLEFLQREGSTFNNRLTRRNSRYAKKTESNVQDSKES